MYIKECQTEEEIKNTFSVMKQLRTQLSDENAYVQLVLSLMESEKLQLASVHDDDDVCVAVASYRIKRSLFRNGHRELYIDDLVTDEQHQSKGFGKYLMEWIIQKAKSEKCSHVALDSGNQRLGAHQFYLNVGLADASKHFTLAIT